MKVRNQYGSLIYVFINQILWSDLVENIFVQVSGRLLDHFYTIDSFLGKLNRKYFQNLCFVFLNGLSPA